MWCSRTEECERFKNESWGCPMWSGCVYTTVQCSSKKSRLKQSLTDVKVECVNVQVVGEAREQAVHTHMLLLWWWWWWKMIVAVSEAHWKVFR